LANNGHEGREGKAIDDAIDPEQTPLLCGRASSESFQPVKLHCAILVVEHVGGQDALRILVRCGSAIMNWAA
jgi:hypothetical protein